MLSFSAKRRGERDVAARIYNACLAAARRPELYLSYGVPDTLQGRFEMVAFSLFPVLNRLMHEPGTTRNWRAWCPRVLSTTWMGRSAKWG